jgi:alkyl hydroperoxide reductase subunit AhpC
LGSDFYPHGAVAEKFGILRTGDPLPGINERAVFIIDKEGIIRSVTILDLGDVPDNDEALDVLRLLEGKTANTTAD